MSENSLTDFLFSPEEDGSILESKESDVLKILREAGKELVSDKRNNIYLNDNLQLLSILSLADFSNGMEEMNAVAGMIRHTYSSTHNMAPYFLDVKEEIGEELDNHHSAYDIGSRILCSLGFFYEKLRKKANVKNLRETGIEMLEYAYHDDVAGNFFNWENFMREYFIGTYIFKSE